MSYILALLAGTTIFLGLAPYGLWYIALLGVLIFAALWQTSLNAKQGFLLAFTFHFGMFAAGVHWLYVSIHVHGQVPAPLTVLFIGGFAAFLSFICSLPWLLSPLIKTRGNRMLAFPALWLLSEWSRSWVLTGFPWLYLGQAHINTPLAGWTPVVGVLGSGLAVAITAVTIICIFTQRTLLGVVAQSAVLILIWGGGHLLNKIEWTMPADKPLSATLVQPNIELEDKWNPARANDILSVLHAESEPYWQDNLVVWPEAALPYVGDGAKNYLNSRHEIATESNSALITGYLTYDSDAQRFHNAIGGIGLADGEYFKQRLVPFGEYVPLEDWLRGLMHFFNLPMSIISAGAPNQQPLSLRQNGEIYIAAPAICYEIAYPILVAEMAKNANLIVTLSNDAWFGNSIGPWQHAEIAQVRALENRKPVIRVTNNGVTASIDHRGEIEAVLPQFQAAALNVEITPMSGATPFSRFGHLPTLCFATLLFLWSLFWRAGTQSKSGL